MACNRLKSETTGHANVASTVKILLLAAGVHKLKVMSFWDAPSLSPEIEGLCLPVRNLECIGSPSWSSQVDCLNILTQAAVTHIEASNAA